MQLILYSGLTSFETAFPVHSTSSFRTGREGRDGVGRTVERQSRMVTCFLYGSESMFTEDEARPGVPGSRGVVETEEHQGPLEP